MNQLALAARRILSIDVFRGMTIFTMVFVNELAGISNIPQWMKHYPAQVDGMTFVDLVFPAFLFIVGMSIPFATQARFSKGDSTQDVFKHVGLRSLALILIGVFMVNAESGYLEEAMVIPISLWTLLMFACVLLIWSHYPKSLSPVLVNGGKILGVVGLLVLWGLYRGPDNAGMTPQWWGILGLIGWAYLIASVIYIASCHCPTPLWQLITLLASALVLLAIFFLLDAIKGQDIPILQTLADNNGNHTHAAIVLGGVILSLLFYHPGLHSFGQQHYFIFTSVVGLLAFISWEFTPISKIWATPSWALFSVLFCCIIFGLIYWLVDVYQKQAWCKLFEPAAVNPLLVYILPYILLSLLALVGVRLRPEFFNTGVAGIIWSFGFAVFIMLIGAGLTRLGLRLKL